MKLLFSMVFNLGLFLAPPLYAEGQKCAICNMPLEKHAKNDISALSRDPTKPAMHLCSLPCLKKLLNHDPSYQTIEVADFNHPDRRIPGDKAFFLIKSEKIKSDITGPVMGPYFGAFASREDAETAKKKYSEGLVVEGISNAIK